MDVGRSKGELGFAAIPGKSIPDVTMVPSAGTTLRSGGSGNVRSFGGEDRRLDSNGESEILGVGNWPRELGSTLAVLVRPISCMIRLIPAGSPV